MLDLDEQKDTVNCNMTYPLFWRRGDQISTQIPETKKEFVDVTPSAGKIVE
jgi:hypothetical protein